MSVTFTFGDQTGLKNLGGQYADCGQFASGSIRYMAGSINNCTLKKQDLAIRSPETFAPADALAGLIFGQYNLDQIPPEAQGVAFLLSSR